MKDECLTEEYNPLFETPIVSSEWIVIEMYEMSSFFNVFRERTCYFEIVR